MNEGSDYPSETKTIESSQTCIKYNNIKINQESIFLKEIEIDNYIINPFYLKSFETILKCPICLKYNFSPLMCNICETPICKECIQTYKNINGKILECPYKCFNSSFIMLNISLKKIMNGLKLRCYNNCTDQIDFLDYENHIQFTCSINKSICTNNQCFFSANKISKYDYTKLNLELEESIKLCDYFINKLPTFSIKEHLGFIINGKLGVKLQLKNQIKYDYLVNENYHITKKLLFLITFRNNIYYNVDRTESTILLHCLWKNSNFNEKKDDDGINELYDDMCNYDYSSSIRNREFFIYDFLTGNKVLFNFNKKENNHDAFIIKFNESSFNILNCGIVFSTNTIKFNDKNKSHNSFLTDIYESTMKNFSLYLNKSFMIKNIEIYETC